ncbi:lytic polysaccharide monooxygenase [Sphaerisporangium corydalis]|uniref:Lytic polysaccharide monooxygenase n=1 Tax=Sphaerisporangium corydalis TaxID=1441875 RepID=A0ABV9EQW6_9ACTN|nr:lytic polysaccharide monooxygenase [Sphaerisporangium corydalis]
MRKTIMIVSTALMTAAITVLSASPALAHGYISSPPSRQAMCAQGRVANCGDIIYEPQSVEGPKGQRSCNGGVARFAQLADESKPWPATSVGTTVTFNWVLTARHSTSLWEYYIGGTRVAVFDDQGRQPGATVSHTVNLSGFSGRQRVLAIWNIADTVNAFYSCVDLQIGGGGGNPTPTPTPTPTPRPTPTPTPTVTVPGGTWAAGTSYAVGAQVTYAGLRYRCLQAHTAIAGWEPPNVPALWQRI